MLVQIFFDAVEDGVRLRSLAAVTFVVLFAAILTLLLGFGTHALAPARTLSARAHSPLLSRRVRGNVVFRDPLQLLGDNHAWSAQIVLPPPAHAQFGKPFQTGALVRTQTLQAESGLVFVMSKQRVGWCDDSCRSCVWSTLREMVSVTQR